MLTKQAKEILKQHDELRWLEKKISNNVRKLSTSAQNELNKFFKSKKKKYKCKFGSLQTYMYSRDWKPVIIITSVSPEFQRTEGPSNGSYWKYSEEWKEFEALLLEASEKIGIEYTVAEDLGR